MFDRVTDMPSILRAGLPTDAQEMVKGIVNSNVYNDNMEGPLAVAKAQKCIESAGYQWNGTRWAPLIAKTKAEGLITKVALDNRLVFGWASVIKTEDGKVLVDRQNDFIDDEWEMEKAAYDYVLNSRDGGVMHVKTGVSTVVESMVFTNEKLEAMGVAKGLFPVGWWLGMKVSDDEVWEGVKKGDYPGFSVHGRGIRKVTEITDDTHSRRGA